MQSSRSAYTLRCRAGYTMTEMVIVVMVMGIITAAAAPAFVNSFVYHRVESAAHRVKTDLDSPYEINTVTVNFGSGAQSVSFNGYGIPTSGGTVVITANGHSATITLEAVTGEVTIASTH
jgi:prepilin-type N-terminal cleavage/methylation domain-containing protein